MIPRDSAPLPDPPVEAAPRVARGMPIAAKLAALAAVFILVTATLVTAVVMALRITAGVRAYVGGEGLWSKGQKDAVYYLTRYAETRATADYDAYRAAMAIPLGDRAARLEMERPEYDYATVEAGFVAGRNAPEDVPALIFLFRNFGEVRYMADAVAIWRAADVLIAELDVMAQELHEAIRQDRLAEPERRGALERIGRLNARLTQMEQEFSATLGTGAREIHGALVAGTLGLAAVLVLGGLWIAWRVSHDLRHGISTLRDSALRVSAGDLEHRVPRLAPDELGEFAQVFDDMIEHRRRAEASLKASTDLARSIVDTASDAYIAMDLEGNVTDWNRQAEATFGWTRAEALGRPLANLIIPARLRESHWTGLARYRATGEGPVMNRRIEVSALRRDGREFPVELTIWAVEMGGVQRINAFLHDIADRQRAVRRLDAQKAAAAALVGGESLHGAGVRTLQAVCEALQWEVGAIWLLDPAGQALRCAEFWHRADLSVPVFEEMTRRITFARGVGLPGRVWSSGRSAWIPDVTRDSNFPRARVAQQDGLHGAFGFPISGDEGFVGVVEFFSKEIQKPDEELLRMMDTLGSLLAQFLGRKRAEAELARRAEELARSNAELEQFAYVASHDLQEPLRTVASYAQLVVKRNTGRLGAESDEFLKFITDGVRRMQALIQGLLAYSRVTRDQQVRERTELTALLDAACQNLRGVIESTGAQVSHGPLPALTVAPAQIAQLFQNLLANAIKFRSREPPRIQVSAERGAAGWTFAVRDNGIGIEPRHAERVFILFQRLHTPEHYEGSGLGLAICKKIVEQHGGRIWVEPGNPGSVFRFTLPPDLA